MHYHHVLPTLITGCMGLEGLRIWLREMDLNQRPLAYEASELPTAPSRDNLFIASLLAVARLLTFR